MYQLYGADGTANGFVAAPDRGTDPESCGWTLVAKVDTRPSTGSLGGQYAVSVSESTGDPLGQFRHLLFDISRTEDRDPFGNTFYSEIDVIDANGPAPVSAPTLADQEILKTFATADGKYQFTVDLTGSSFL